MLALVRCVHTAIYVVMSASVLALFYAGATGAKGLWLWPALALVAIEAAVFVGNGFRCPFTALAARYAPEAQPISDTYFPERLTRHTLQVFGPLIVIALLMLAARLWLAQR